MTLDIYYYGFYNEILLRFRPSSLSRASRVIVIDLSFAAATMHTRDRRL